MRKYHTINDNNFGWEFKEDMPVFMTEYGASIGSFSNALETILKETGMLYNVDGKKRSAM